VSAATAPLPEPTASAPLDAIAAQVDDDLDDLTEVPTPNARGSVVTPQPTDAKTARLPIVESPQPDDVVTVTEEDPADFLLEALPEKTPPAPVATPQPAQPTAAHKQPQGPQMSTVLAAIATELLAESHSEERARPLAINGALAVLMSMSEEERIALFS
jgi:hypothetical protein